MQWRKQGDEQWQSAGLPLPGGGKHELVFMRGHLNQFRCASCGKSLNETPYLWWRTVPHAMLTTLIDKKYCIEHSPIPIETQQGPTLEQLMITLSQAVATLGQRIAALEQRVTQLEAAQKPDNQDSQQ